MKILFLYENQIATRLSDWLIAEGNELKLMSGPLEKSFVVVEQFDLIVSYTYRHILPKDVIDEVHGNIVNLHISYLPWNRGASPNQWSWIENTPKGVTLHFIDEGIDTGDIIAQRIVHIKENETLKSSYELLNDAVIALFKAIYPLYSFWNDMRKKAMGKGSYHKAAQLMPYEKIIGDYQICVSEFQRHAKLIKNKNDNNI